MTSDRVGALPAGPGWSAPQPTHSVAHTAAHIDAAATAETRRITPKRTRPTLTPAGPAAARRADTPRRGPIYDSL
ncbi:hypothetical protein MPRM_24460 [Mycobacterium parmense]|uniref:Uncharacterized protein n=1 Tax=Mycobacterium parmense TaxID=185642 RepID=A0A7I7YTG8_9MYCO|nr:hypothetical protein MPRM_24460 [Mycobacterium parmense]